MRELCFAAVSVHSFANTDTVFIEGTQAKDMYFIHDPETSVVTYHSSLMEVGRNVKLVGGSWLVEGALWMPWRFRGDLIASTEVEILMVNASKFSTMICVYSDLHFVAHELAFSFWGKLIGAVTMPQTFQCNRLMTLAI